MPAFPRRIFGDLTNVPLGQSIWIATATSAFWLIFALGIWKVGELIWRFL